MRAALAFAGCGGLGSGEAQQLLLLGLEGAGKTTLLYKLKLPGWTRDEVTRDVAAMKREMVHPDGTIGCRDPGYHYEELRGYNLRQYGVWDVPGSDAFVRLWPMFYRYVSISAVVFVIDHFSPERHDLDRIQRARELIHTLLSEDELRACCFWIILNVGYSDEGPSAIEVERERATLEMLGVPELKAEPAHAERLFEASINCAEVTKQSSVWELVLRETRRMYFRIGEGSGRLK